MLRKDLPMIKRQLCPVTQRELCPVTCNIILLDISLCGGISESRKRARLSHGCTASSVNLHQQRTDTVLIDYFSYF